MSERIPGLEFEGYTVDTLPLGMRFRRKLEPVVGSVVVASGGYPTGSGASVTITAGPDSHPDAPDPDPGGDPAYSMI